MNMDDIMIWNNKGTSRMVRREFISVCHGREDDKIIYLPIKLGN